MEIKRIKIMDAVWKKPEGMDDVEHLSVMSMTENKMEFYIEKVVFREQFTRDKDNNKISILDNNGQPTGEYQTNTVADVLIKNDNDEKYHLFISTRNLVGKLKKMVEYVEHLDQLENINLFYKLRIVTKKMNKGDMYDFEDVE